MENLMRDKALLVVAAVGIFASGYYFGEFRVLHGISGQGAAQSASAADSAYLIEQDLQAGAYRSLDTINLSEDPFQEIEDVSIPEGEYSDVF